jgi:hypothetical protein
LTKAQKRDRIAKAAHLRQAARDASDPTLAHGYLLLASDAETAPPKSVVRAERARLQKAFDEADRADVRSGLLKAIGELEGQL